MRYLHQKINFQNVWPSFGLFIPANLWSGWIDFDLTYAEIADDIRSELSAFFRQTSPLPAVVLLKVQQQSHVTPHS